MLFLINRFVYRDDKHRKRQKDRIKLSNAVESNYQKCINLQEDIYKNLQAKVDEKIMDISEKVQRYDLKPGKRHSESFNQIF